MAKAETLPVPVQTVPALVEGSELTNFTMAKLAREVVMNMRELPEILAMFKLSNAQFNKIKKHEFYKRVSDQFAIDWHGAMSTEARIKIEAAIALENAMPNMAARMDNATEPLPAVVEAGKLFTKLAGIGDEKSGSNPGDKFSIVINLGEDVKLKFEKDVTPSVPLIDEKPNEPT